MGSSLEIAILALLAERDPGKTICPSEAARAVGGEHWRRLMPQVRFAAVQMAQAGELEITRHGKPVDPLGFKGVYRLRLPAPESVGADQGETP